LNVCELNQTAQIVSLRFLRVIFRRIERPPCGFPSTHAIPRNPFALRDPHPALEARVVPQFIRFSKSGCRFVLVSGLQRVIALLDQIQRDAVDLRSGLLSAEIWRKYE